MGVQQARYEVSVGQNNAGEVVLLGENLWLKPRESRPRPLRQPNLFPQIADNAPSNLVLPEGGQSPKGWRRILNKKPEAGNDYFRAETTDWNNNFRLGPSKSTLANLPEDEERFPVSLWLKELLLRGVQRIMLNSEQMRRPSPPGGSRAFQADGSNLPWVIEDLRRERPHVYEQWIAHVQTALPDIDTIEAIERPEDRHRYLRIKYANGLVAPSWVVSDGTLRLLALTLIAYVQLQDRIYLIEEPENGIHPRAVEVVLQSLSSLYDSQVLCASHSPVVLSLAERESILCFARTQDGATDIVSGNEHPALGSWKGEVDLGTLFAVGVLG